MKTFHPLKGGGEGGELLSSLEGEQKVLDQQFSIL